MQELTFTLQSEYIELYKLLKLMGLTESGGEAKQAIANGEVLVNNQVEERKAFKVRPGTVVTFSDSRISVSGQG